MTSESFVSKFHNIDGLLVGERKRKINKLLQNKNVSSNDEQFIVDNLKPKTYLETMMYIDILIHFKKTVQLLEILKSGNEACVSKIIKQEWFFKEAFGNVSAEEFVTEILPSMSFSVKMKALKELSFIFPVEKMDEVFDCVLKRYGLFIAKRIIPACSSQKIENILTNHVVKLSTNQLKIIQNKQPNLINIYLDVHKQEKDELILENSFLIYLAQNDLALFWNLLENGKIKKNLKLGRKTTKKLIEAKRCEIISNPEKYIKYLRCETLVRNLNKLGEFKTLYRNAFPKCIEQLQGNVQCNDLLKYYPKHSQYQLYTETFSDVLNENILSNLKCLGEYFFEVIIDMDLREKLAQLKYSETGNELYIKYYKPETCFTLVKEKDNLTSGHLNGNLLYYLVLCCALNKDLKCLEKVLCYFCERYQDYDEVVRYSILHRIRDEFKLEDLNDNHWKYLYTIFAITQNPSKYHFDIGFQTHLRIMHTKHLIKNNRSEDEINYSILECLKYIVTHRQMFGNYSFVNRVKDFEIEKKVLMMSVEHLPSIMKAQNKEEQSYSFYSSLLMAILSYNLRHPMNLIMFSGNEKLMEILRMVFGRKDNHFWCYYDILRRTICKLNRNNSENEILTYYWEYLVVHQVNDKIMLWFLKYEPSIISENIDNILKYNSSCKIWSRLKLYSHLNLDNTVINHCLKKLEEDAGDYDDDEDDYEDKVESVRRLSVIATSEHYIKIMEDGNFIPKTPKLIIEQQRSTATFAVQKAFLKNWKNLNNPLKYLPMLIDRFCQGDYLKSSLPALYSTFHRCPENELKPYLHQIFENPATSIKKHALNLACCVFEQQMIFRVLEDLEKSDGDSSLQKCTFISCLKYFSKNPSDEVFEKVVFHMGLLSEQDIDSLNTLQTVNISKHYMPHYKQHILRLLEKFKETDKEGSRS